MSKNGTCPEPFLAQFDYPERGGDINSRLCAPVPSGDGLMICCLPCPRQNFFYPDYFGELVHATIYVNLASVIACSFLLLSFIVLPTEYTNRHYLSICLAFAILLMELSFIIPLGSKKTQCFDAITPHDMFSSVNCALSGALLLGGGWCTVMWAFLRTLSLHLQICWQVVPGRKFFLSAQAAGWSIPVAFMAVALSVTGVSFRFGESCHINSRKGLQSFWGPLLSVAAGSIVMQLITFGYCIHVYLKSLMEDKPGTTQASSGSGLPYTNSIRTVTAAQAFRRIRRVAAMQWRGIFVVIIILADVVFFATVFLQFDGTTQKTPENFLHVVSWIGCIVEHNGDKNQCLSKAHEFVVNEATSIAVLFLLSLNGLWALLLLGRPEIYKGWWHLIKKPFSRKKRNDEFVSYNARRVSEPSSSYEMLESKRRDTLVIPPPEPALASPTVSRPPVNNIISEYNPSTFSAQLRERADSLSGSPYRDDFSGARSPPLGSPFSPFKDYPEYQSGLQKSRSNSLADRSPYSPYADSPVSPQYPAQSARGGPSIGVAQ